MLKKSVRDYMAEIGRNGGSAKSKKKARASRMNGRKGGRPREGGKK